MKRFKFPYGLLLPSLLAAFLICPRPAETDPSSNDTTGVIAGEVRCGDSGVAYANVVVLGTRLGAQTDNHGRFEIKGVPIGLCRVRALALGSRAITDSTIVQPGVLATLDFLVHPYRVYWYETLWKGGTPFFLSDSDSNLVLQDCRIEGDWARASSPEGSFRVVSSTREPATLTFDYDLTPQTNYLTLQIADSSGIVRKKFPRRRVKGGQATWDGKGDDGKPVPKGTYSIWFITDRDTARITAHRGLPRHSAIAQY